jgi:hypothetical protein
MFMPWRLFFQYKVKAAIAKLQSETEDRK